TFTVSLLDARVEQPDLDVRLHLHNPVNASVGEAGEAMLTIHDADVPVYQLDGQGRVTLVGFSDGSSRSYTYDGGSGKISTFTDERGHVTGYTYDGAGNRL